MGIEAEGEVGRTYSLLWSALGFWDWGDAFDELAHRLELELELELELGLGLGLGLELELGIQVQVLLRWHWPNRLGWRDE